MQRGGHAEGSQQHANANVNGSLLSGSRTRDGPCERPGSSQFASASLWLHGSPLPCLDHAAGLLILVLQWAAKEASGCEGLKGEGARGKRAGRKRDLAKQLLAA